MGGPGEAYEKPDCPVEWTGSSVMGPEARSGPPLRVAPKKLPVVLLKTGGVAVHAAEVPAVGKLRSLPAKAAKKASIGQT